MLVFIPISLMVQWLGLPRIWLFLTTILAIIPIASLISGATEGLSDRAGTTIGGLLNATFGNAPELIIGIFALRAGLVRMVKASISGSILGNILFALGMSMLVGGWNREKQVFNRVAAGQRAAMLMLAVVALVMPAVFDLTVFGSLRPSGKVIDSLSLMVAGVLILTYTASLVFSFLKHQHRTPLVPLEPIDTRISVAGLVTLLAVATVFAALESEMLVSSVQATTKALGLTEFFIGVIILSLVGNVAEYFAAISMATKNRMDLSVTIATASGTQIALFLAPMLVFISFLFGHPMSLIFNPFEIASLSLAVVVVAIVSLDGESNWLEGLQLVAIYLVLAIVFFFVPNA
jgi:Ca2+:H+ antiporter